MKLCTKCGIEKECSAFAKKRSSKDGLQEWCKECRNVYNKRWKKANREKEAQYNKRWREANRDYQRHYYKANKEKKSQYNKRWNEANKEKKSQCNREYRQTEKGKLVTRLSQHNRRYRKQYNTNPGDRLTTNQIEYLTEIYTHCAYCGKELTSDNTHIEHIQPLSKGGAHSIDNVVLACKDCNLRKNAKTLDQWLSVTGYSISIKHLVFMKLEEKTK
jgi:5-methylcytosine-specific restriction endonuclease McrA